MPAKHIVLGIIPARGGSKGIKNKNITPLCGRPLLSYTFDAALGSKTLTRCILSTDDEAIAGFAKRDGIDVPFMRPQEFAGDDALMIDVIMNALDTLKKTDGFQPDIVVLLQPTSPLRTAAHIDEAVRMLEDTGADAIVSVVQVPHRFSPGSVMRQEGEFLVPFLEKTDVLRRQDKPLLYARNGPAILAVRTVQLQKGDFYSGRTLPYIMDESSSIDIDGPVELLYAEATIKARQ